MSDMNREHAEKRLSVTIDALVKLAATPMGEPSTVNIQRCVAYLKEVQEFFKAENEALEALRKISSFLRRDDE